MKLKLSIKSDGLEVGETFSQFPGNGTITILKLGADWALTRVDFRVGSDPHSYNCTAMRWALVAEKTRDWVILGMSPPNRLELPRVASRPIYLRRGST